jgi:DNA-binding CsgD family transcriptional regulator
MSSSLVGREKEWAGVRLFLEDDAVEPACLLLDGDPGIGKTALWRAGIEAAKSSGYRVLTCAPDGSEAGITLAALGDLLEPVTDELLPELPVPQRNALEIAMLRREGPAPSHREVGKGVLAMLEAIAKDGLVVGIDDEQWLDGASAACIAFALRRMTGSKFRLLVARRAGGEDPLGIERLYPAERLRHENIGPLGAHELGKIVSAKLGVNLALPVLDTLAERSGGNPFFAIEIARNASDPQLRDFSIPQTLLEAVQARLEKLSDEALEVGLIAAASSRPTVAMIARAAGNVERTQAGLEEAERADVLCEEGGRVLFTHPLLGSTIYASAPAAKRRVLHRRLAAIVDDVEQRARHLALAADGPDETTATLLEEASDVAVARGAPAGAARLLEQSAALTPATQERDRRRRLLQAAQRHFDSGDASRAQRIAEDTVAACPAGVERAKALATLASVVEGTEGLAAGLEIYFRALDEAEGDPAQQASIYEQLAWNSMSLSPSRSLEYARTALGLLDRVDDVRLHMIVLTVLAEAEFRLGLESTHDTIERAIALEKIQPAEFGWESPLRTRSLQLWRMERLDEARELIDRCGVTSTTAGDEASRVGVLLTRGTIDLSRGDAPSALGWLEAASELAKQTGMEADDVCIKTFSAMGLAYVGRSADARRTATEALKDCEDMGNERFAVHNLSVLGLSDLYDGELGTARAHLERAHVGMLKNGVVEPNFFHTLVPDYAEVLTGLGEYARAEHVLAFYEAWGQKLDRKTAIGHGARCRGLIAAGRGRAHEADRLLNEAVDVLAKAPSAHDLGRALASLGVHYRRTKRKRLARETLDRAVEVFESVGAVGWADKARTELARIGGRTPGGLELTDTESQVAKLVAEGLTNKEVAERLYISVRTVETNLSKVYRKLQVRSRTELANQLARH